MIARDWGAREIIIESDFGQEALAHLMQPVVAKLRVPAGDATFPGGWNASVESAPASRKSSKEQRIIAVMDRVMSAHRLVMNKSALELTPGLEDKYQNQYQLTHIQITPGSMDHDDRIDALAGACAPFADYLHVSPEDAERKMNEAAREAEIRKRIKADQMKDRAIRRPQVPVWNDQRRWLPR